MKEFVLIDASDIEESLCDVSREYLVGNLSRPQSLSHIFANELEIGISDYKEFSVEPAHTHSECNEYQYVLSGYTEYLNIDTNKIHKFKKGDFYFIPKGVKYVQKAKAGTRILFIKTPSKNDKLLLESTKEITNFITAKIESARKDYFHNTNAPKANSIRPAAAVAIIKDKFILMVQRKDNGKWSLPGGTLEFNETLQQCALREIKEETSLGLKELQLFKIYDDPNAVVEYLDGEVRREFTIVYIAYLNDDVSVKLDSESKAYAWVKFENLLDLDLADSQRVRIEDLNNYLK